MGTRIPLRRMDARANDMSEKLEMSTAEIGLSVRTTNCLEERGIFTVDDLLHCTREDLLAISNFGEKTLEEVYKALEGIGFFRRAKRETMTDDDAYHIVKGVIDNLGKLTPVHGAVRSLTVEKMSKIAGIAMHPGAAKAYKEAGF